MVFSSLVFIYFFLPITLAVYYIFPRRWRNTVLLISSLVFYGWGEPVWISIMIFSCVLDYTCSNIIEKYRSREKICKAALAASIAGNLGILIFFKYGAFLISNFSILCPALSGINLPDMSLPIGISFYTFQTMSCTIDVYRREAEAQKNPVDFATYVTMFPQLIAGPIVRYKDVSKQLTERTETVDKFASGIVLFSIGLAKKVLLANPFGELWSQVQALETPSALTAVLGVFFFSFQIYFDFSGYSDMARGLGRMLGFELPINFNYPYISKSITEFWRRWHITLGTWFREYVYIPLGGNRRGKARTIFNIFIVWFLTGLWHGASWNFVLWGLYYGMLLFIEKIWLLKAGERIPELIKHIYVIIATLFGWVLFSFTDTSSLFAFLGVLCGENGLIDNWALYQLRSCFPLIIIGIIACTPLSRNLWDKLKSKMSVRFSEENKNSWIEFIKPVLVFLIFILVTASLVNNSYNPFLYFRF